MNHVSVFAPASVANISCGFDVLGVCLDNIGDTLHIQETSKPGIEITEIIGQDLPLDPKKNVASVAGMALLADHNSDRGFEIKIEKGESTNTIQLSDEIGITMKYPTVKDLINFGNEKSTVKMTFDIVQSCTVNIFDANDVYEDFSRKELQDFFDQLNTEQFDKIQKFFDEMPKLRHTIKVKNPNTGVESDIVLEGLQSFLG